MLAIGKHNFDWLFKIAFKFCWLGQNYFCHPKAENYICCWVNSELFCWWSPNNIYHWLRSYFSADFILERSTQCSWSLTVPTLHVRVCLCWAATLKSQQNLNILIPANQNYLTQQLTILVLEHDWRDHRQTQESFICNNTVLWLVAPVEVVAVLKKMYCFHTGGLITGSETFIAWLKEML